MRFALSVRQMMQTGLYPHRSGSMGYHLNINLQMNYWPAGPANLAETVAPLMDWFELLAQRGRESARRLYESDGWVAFLATNPFGRVPEGEAPTKWVSMHA